MFATVNVSKVTFREPAPPSVLTSGEMTKKPGTSLPLLWTTLASFVS